MRFLGFRLYAPLCSFGDVAVGERRPTLPAPTRSMLLGLVGACLGILREDEEAQAELERTFGVATRTDAEGVLLVDYHTAQSPDGPRLKEFRKVHGFPAATRREELATSTVGTQLSQRQYRTDAVFAGCIWMKAESSRWDLTKVAAALQSPTFVPFAGRKGAALAMPLQPSIVEAANPVAALQALAFPLDDLLRPLLKDAKEQTFRWEGNWSDLKAARTEVRRDRIGSRERWQFLTREEHVLTVRKEVEDDPKPD